MTQNAMNYYEYDENATLTCNRCGWSGKAKDADKEYFDQLFTVDCPNCGNLPSLLAVEYPTIQETKDAAAGGNKEAVSNLPVALLVEDWQTLRQKAERLVQERITGSRKGLPDAPAHLHSFRVGSLLGENDCEPEVVLAGLLHDVIEDGGVTVEELRGIGCSKRMIELVQLCSHPMEIKNSTERWVLMMAKLIQASDVDAWAIKLADLADNLTECHAMSADKRRFMVNAKVPILLKLTERFTELQSLRDELKVEAVK
jgi:(p)ppGpp synthase/HD superfamily hydrolase